MTAKFDWKRALKICLCIFGLFLCITYWHPFVKFLGKVLSASTPLLIGAFIAFIVNIIMSRLEGWFFPKKQRGFFAKIRRPFCLVMALLVVVLVLTAVVWLIVPQLVNCIQVIISFFTKLPGYVKDILVKAEEWGFVPDDIIDYLTSVDWESMIGQVVAFITSGVGGFVNTVAKTVMSVVSGIITFIIGFIFSLYLLLEKDKLKRQFTRVSKNYLPEKLCKKIFYFLSVLDDCFRKYIVGQLTEAVILGVLCTLGMLILRLPYATMIGALIAVTALIPVAGAYIGAITGALMIMTQSPLKALIFIVFIIALQQFEGNVIYPRVVGSSIGLPGIWVLVAVTVGGGCFGIVGMLIGVPLASAVYRVIREDMDRREGLKPDKPCAAVGVSTEDPTADDTEKN